MQNSIITVRIHAGFNADAFLAGLLALTGQTSGTASAFLAKLFPEVEAGIDFGPRSVRSIAGYTARTLVAEAKGERPPIKFCCRGVIQRSGYTKELISD